MQAANEPVLSFLFQSEIYKADFMEMIWILILLKEVLFALLINVLVLGIGCSIFIKS